MKQILIPKPVDQFMTRTLSGRVFTWREILSLIIPGILDSLSVMFINMLITALISSNGEASVAAVSLVTPITWMITCIFSGVSAGGTVIVAQCCGSKDTTMLQRSIGMTLWMTVLVGVAVCLPLLLFPQAILLMLYPEAEAIVLEKARVYLAGSAATLLVFTVYNAIFAILRGLGESKRCLALSIVINVAYLVFSILLLNYLKLDIYGSVYALMTARIIGAGTAVALLFLWRPPVKPELRQMLFYDRGLMGRMLKISIPLGVEQLCISFGNIVAEMYMIPLGTTALATHAIVNSLIGLLYSPAMASGYLAVTIVGRCIGAAEFQEARMYGKRCNQIALILVILASLVFYPLLPVLLQQYNPTPEAAAMATKLLFAAIPCLLLFWPVSNTLPSTLRAASDTVYPTVLSLAVMWLVNIALGYYLAIPAGLGLWGIWGATWASWVVRSIGFSLRFRGQKWLCMTVQKGHKPE